MVKVLFASLAFILSSNQVKAEAIDASQFNEKNFSFDHHQFSAEIFKEGTYFIHLTNIASPDLVTAKNPQGKYRFSTSHKSFDVGDRFCKAILGKDFKQVMTDISSDDREPFTMDLRQIRCEREKTVAEVLKKEQEACRVYQRPTVFAPNCNRTFSGRTSVNDDDRSSEKFLGLRAPAIVRTSGSIRR